MQQKLKRAVYIAEYEDGTSEEVRGVEFVFDGQTYYYTDVFHDAEVIHVKTGCHMCDIPGRPSAKKAIEMLEKLQAKHGRDAYNESLVMAEWI